MTARTHAATGRCRTIDIGTGTSGIKTAAVVIIATVYVRTVALCRTGVAIIATVGTTIVRAAVVIASVRGATIVFVASIRRTATIVTSVGRRT